MRIRDPGITPGSNTSRHLTPFRSFDYMMGFTSQESIPKKYYHHGSNPVVSLLPGFLSTYKAGKQE